MEGVAYASWWMPVMLGVAHDGDVDDGKPPRDLSHEPTEPTPVVSPSRALPSSEPFDLVRRPLPFIAIGREMIAWWASSALLCAIVFLLSVYAFNGKVCPLIAQRALVSPCTPLIHSIHLPPLRHPPLCLTPGPGAGEGDQSAEGQRAFV